MKKVLIVDDSKTVLSLLKSEIQKHDGIDAYFAEDYKSSMRLIREHHGDFHAAILDLDLPDAPHGEIVGLANSHHIPAVILTATLDENLKDSIIKKDIIDFILKNDPSSIKFAINAILRTLKNYDTNVLVVDDSKLYRTTISDSLKKIHLNIIEAEDGEEALEVLKSRDDISLIITDYEMPKLNGMELTLKVRELYKKDQLAIIAVSSLDAGDVTANFLKFGANDFIHKPFAHTEITTRINSNLELLDLFSQIKDMANKDFLTGCYNRRYFFDSSNHIHAKAKRKQVPLVLATIDIDKFKNINDTYGHDVGDVAIKAIKNILDNNLRASDLLARFGGEEFCILLEEISIENTKLLFEKIRLAFEKNIITTNEVTFSYTVSTGIYYGLSDSIEDMIRFSDEALYEAKETGRNKVIIHA